MPRTVVFAALFAAAAALIQPSAAETPVERGRYLVNGIASCGNCHSPQQPEGTVSGPPLSGGNAIASPAFTAYPPNLTPDRDTGLGSWTADQIVTAIREGVTPDGKVLRPPMPVAFYRGMSDRDAYAIAAYLQSLAPVRNQVPASSYRQPTPPGYGGPVGAIPDPDPSDKVAYGHYLAQMGHCMLCHTPRDANGRIDTSLLGAGGVPVGDAGIITPNITPDPKFGIGAWTDGQIADALTKGVRPDGSHLAPPMPWPYLATMSDQDIGAITAYLRTLKPIAQ
ncbi:MULTISPECIES: c-type cytochrome [unclassified Inquilinus]|uniref:c-type cytochrome n=1 Tax=unclassified Inquilinus TaxID=2645927 RepID=UPI003F92EEC7